MKQYKIKRLINGELEVVGFEYHTKDDGKEIICHKTRKVELNNPRIPGEFPMIEGDIKELAK